MWYAHHWSTPKEYKPKGREADLWGYLVNLEHTGFELVWEPPTEKEQEEHWARVAAVKHIGTLIDQVRLQFGRATKCCVIQVGKGNKYNTRCIHGEAPFFQGTGLVNTVTLRAPTHNLITIRPSTKKDEAFRQLRLMKRCIAGWLRTGEDLPARTPSVEMRPSQWEHFAHDLVWYVTQTKRLAQQNRGIRWNPTPPRDTK
jgi:hypothetical protein